MDSWSTSLDVNALCKELRKMGHQHVIVNDQPGPRAGFYEVSIPLELQTGNVNRPIVWLYLCD